MPNYRTHDAIGIGISPVIAIASISMGFPVKDTAFLITGFLLATYFLSPDLDLNSKIYRRWGALKFLWYPYRQLIHHRSWLSHSGPISATLRLAYLSILLAPVFYIAHVDLLTLAPWYGIIWLSVSLSDTVHLIADKVWR